MSSITDSCITQGVGCHSATNYPQFIDTSACLCGFIDSPVGSANGNQIQYWRCIGDANQDVAHGDHGKWFQSSLPSEELSGINQPQNWGDNPPNTKQAYVLVTDNGHKKYEELQGKDSPQLVGNDGSCTGKNNTQLSSQYYQNSKHGHSHGSSRTGLFSHTSTASTGSSTASASKSASNSASATSSASSSAASAAAATTSASSSTPATSSSSASSASASQSSSSDATRSIIKPFLLVGLLAIPALLRAY